MENLRREMSRQLVAEMWERIAELGRLNLRNLEAQRASVKIARILSDELGPALHLDSRSETLTAIFNAFDEAIENVAKGEKIGEQFGFWKDDRYVHLDLDRFFAASHIPRTDENLDRVLSSARGMAARMGLELKEKS